MVEKWFYIGAGVVGASLLGLLISQANAAPLEELKKMDEQMFSPSIQLNKNCSGTLIYSDRDKEKGTVNTIALTAKHCIDAADQRLDVMTYVYNKSNRLITEEAHKAKVLGMSYKSDLALIKLEDQNTIFPVAKVAKKETGESLKFGQDIWNVSYPKGGSRTLTQGVLGYVEIVDAFKTKTGEFYRMTPDIAPGSSGSGMFQNTTGDYELIGVVTGMYSGFSYMGLITPIEEINEYLDVAKTTYEVKKDEEVKK